MLTAEATVATSRASRYLTQLCRHADQMRRIGHRTSRNGDEQMPAVLERVEYSSTAGTVRFADGMLHVRASRDTLTLRIEAADEDSLRRLQNGIGRRLRTIGRRDKLALTWGRPDMQPDRTRSAPTTRTRHRNRRGERVRGVAGSALSPS
ncbi:DUF2218 domain-containing protein [Mycolicibacterium arseniciresistens]|uniref:DUF2218 domain-containing protein n=1 Tax=Mycolicibacterium arseniciresistens TaxID=3062257 RepID=A0ABT8U9Y1_9MYCO|nr:DUF2218 domain-containing protein [Mycolicibacterium arseniciresistens]MDO3634591.1 DUF2218 domain-containing protein [Mycolicibacterium arseniciresistens]